jgi:hypothetical protein
MSEISSSFKDLKLDFAEQYPTLARGSVPGSNGASLVKHESDYYISFCVICIVVSSSTITEGLEVKNGIY